MQFDPFRIRVNANAIPHLAYSLCFSLLTGLAILQTIVSLQPSLGSIDIFAVE